MRMKMIVNSLRNALGGMLGIGLDNKRSKAWCEYGYKEVLEFDDFMKAYRRHGLAFRAVNHITSKTWSDYPVLYRGSKSEEDEVQDPYEIRLNDVFNDSVWYEFKEADKRRLIGRWSGLILYYNDAHQVSMGDPVFEGSTLRNVKAAWADALKVLTYDENNNPLTWSYTAPAIDGVAKESVTIHNDRVFILGDMTTDGMSLLEPGYNYLVNLEKVEGGSAESYSKNAARQVHLNFDAEAETGGDYQEDDDPEHDKKVKENMNKLVRDLNIGNDTALVTQGVTATPLTTNVPDPTPTFDINAISFAASVNIPYRVLIGNQSGERASTEDLKQDNANIQSRREADITREILRFVNKCMRSMKWDIWQIGVTWEDLTVPSATEKVDLANKLALINKEVGFITGELPFTVDEIRSAAGYDTSTDNTEI